MADKIEFEEAKGLWKPKFPWPVLDGHKYTRGHVVVIGGPLQTSGAAKLSATAAIRTAAGAVTVLVPTERDLEVYIASNNIKAIMWDTYEKLEDLLASKNVTAVIIGPGLGRKDEQQEILQKILVSDKSAVVDADGLTKPFSRRNTIITPHEGEFERMFPDIAGTREEKARRAAELTSAVVLLKGRETVIASPDGRYYINPPATPWLGTAGSGDTLSGIIGGLVAAQMPLFEAAIAGCFIHSRAGECLGPGLIADDLVQGIPEVLKEISLERVAVK